MLEFPDRGRLVPRLIQLALEPVDSFYSMRQMRAETPPLSRFERDIPNFPGTPDLQTGQLADQPCP
jgi:hypothetical protein